MNIQERLKLSREWATLLLYNALCRERMREGVSSEKRREIDERAHVSLRAEWMEYGDKLTDSCDETPGSITILNMINIRRALESATVTIQEN